MKYITLTNRNRNVMRFFADSKEDAIDQALERRFIIKRENANVIHILDVCDKCFPVKGMAALMLAPKRIYIALPHGCPVGGFEQKSHALHPSHKCHPNYHGAKISAPSHHGLITKDGFTQ